MATILLIDTATLQCSVAVSVDGRCVASEAIRETGYVHAEKLMPMVDRVLNEANKPQLDAVAVTGGPGSFTGLRIGVSTAKGLCQGLQIPLIELDPLALLAVQGKRLDPSPRTRVAMIDARRMEAYAASFDDTNPSAPAKPWILGEDADEWGPDAQFIGDGAKKMEEGLGGDGRTFVEAWPLASDGCGLAEEAFQAASFVDLPHYEPNYIKAFKAGAPKDPLGLRSKAMSWLMGLVLLCTTCFSCGEQPQYIPYVPVNFYIDLNLPSYNALQFPGEAILIPLEGSKGIYIYRLSTEEFVALDRHSTHDVALGCRVTLDDDNIILRDDTTCSMSQWSMLDGTVLQGPATLPLQRYRTTLDGPSLRVFN